MRWFLNSHLFNHSWETVSSANWIKYPNEVTSHVIHVDYLSRVVDPETGIMYSERLITCKQNVPELILKLVGGSNEAFIYEKSSCDPKTRSLTLHTKNLTFSHLIDVEETCKYTPSPLDPQKETQFTQEVRISSLNGWSTFRNYIEDFSLERFKSNAMKGKQALEQVLSNLCQDTKCVFSSAVETTFPGEICSQSKTDH